MGKQKNKSVPLKWTRTTVLLKEEHLDKLKLLSWLEDVAIKDLFDSMIEEFLASKKHLRPLLEERERLLEQRDSVNC